MLVKNRSVTTKGLGMCHCRLRKFSILTEITLTESGNSLSLVLAIGLSFLLVSQLFILSNIHSQASGAQTDTNQVFMKRGQCTFFAG